MIKISSITTLGFLILLTASPFISIPKDWKNYTIILFSLIIIILSLFLRKELHKVIKALHSEDDHSSNNPYVENNL